MKIREIVITLALCVTALVATHWIAEGRRYDVVAVGAGSGGSQSTEGSTDFKAYLIDHKTGELGICSSLGLSPCKFRPADIRAKRCIPTA